MTSKRGSVVSNSLTSRSRSSASMVREARSSRIHSRSRPCCLRMPDERRRSPCLASRKRNRLAGDRPRRLAAQPQHRRRDLFRLDEAALRIGRRRGSHAPRSTVRPVLSTMRRTDSSSMSVSTKPGQTALTVTPVLASLGRQRAHQADDAVLGRDVGRDIGIALQAGRRGDEDDPAGLARDVMPASAGFTVRNAPVRLTSSVRCQSPSEVRVRRGAARHAGIGDDDVDRARARFAASA